MKSPLGYTLRRDIADPLLAGHFAPDFLELAPENWIGLGGIWKRKLDQLNEQFRFTAHGLSLSIGSPEPVNIEGLKVIKQFLDDYNIDIYSEHLAFSSIDNAHMYESMPIPFTIESLNHIAEKVRVAQEVLERSLVLENVCYYILPESDMSELQYIKELQQISKCGLLLDVSNVYVNAKNHGYCSQTFFRDFPFEHVHYVHVGSYDTNQPSVIFDSHDRAIDKNTLYDLLKIKDEIPSNVPICLERESNFEPLDELVNEFKGVRKLL
ncbi:MAG: DUF692 domain-containing protein [Crocinitomicaceae bacterium]|nr:DUF692 domain-containing protein [Crocinitomicaceae bacterium]